MTAFVYCRVSTREQADRVSLEVQEQDCREWAEAKGYPVEVFVDAGWSGRRFDRPALTEMLGRLGEAAVLVVWKMDRLARDNVDRGLIMRECRRRGAELVSVTQPEVSGDSPETRLVSGVLGAVAEFESALIGARVRAGQQRRAEAGERWQKPPYGYDRDWQPVPDQVDVIDLIDDLYLSGMGTVRIAQQLNAERHPTPTGRGQWWGRGVRDILTRSIYSGISQWGKVRRRGTTVVPRPEDTWVVADVDIEVVRPLERRERIMAAMEARTKRRTSYARSVFAGLLLCGCGSSMSGYSWLRRSTGERVYAYGCSAHRGGGVCLLGGTRVREADVLETVVDAAAAFVAGGPMLLPESRDRDRLEEQLERLETRRRRAREAFLSGRLDADEFDEETDLYHVRRDRLDAALKDAGEGLAAPLPPEVAVRLLEAPGNRDEAREWAHDVLERLWWDGESLEVVWRLQLL